MNRDEARKIVGWSISIVIGFFLMIPLGLLFDALNLPVFNSWALFHVSFMFTWPTLSWICFRIVSRVWLERFKPK